MGGGRGKETGLCSGIFQDLKFSKIPAFSHFTSSYVTVLWSLGMFFFSVFYYCLWWIVPRAASTVTTSLSEITAPGRRFVPWIMGTLGSRFSTVATYTLNKLALIRLVEIHIKPNEQTTTVEEFSKVPTFTLRSRLTCVLFTIICSDQLCYRSKRQLLSLFAAANSTAHVFWLFKVKLNFGGIICCNNRKITLL